MAKLNPYGNWIIRSYISKGFTLPGKWTLNELPPHLPSELIYISDGFYHGYDENNKQPINVKLRVPYDAGYTCAVFTATSITNINGMSIPTGFYFERSQTPLGNRSPDMPRGELFGEVATVKVHTDIGQFLPPYQGEVMIHDAIEKIKLPPNSANSNYMIYKAHDGNWPKGDTLKTLERKQIHTISVMKREQDKALIQKQFTDNEYKRRIVFIVFLLTSFTTLALILSKGLGRTKSK